MARPITDEMINKANEQYHKDLKEALYQVSSRSKKLNEDIDDVDIKSYKVVPNKMLKGSFADMVSHLQRPYIPISQEDYEYLMKEGEENNSDFFEKDGVLYTYGGSGDGYALMPFVDEEGATREVDINAIKELPNEDVYQAYLNGDITYDEYREICVDRDESIELPYVGDENYDSRAILLAKYLDVDIDDIQEHGTNLYSVNGGEQEWLVLTEDEARDEARDSLERAVEDGLYEVDSSYMDNDSLEDVMYNDIIDYVDQWSDDEIIEYCIDNDLVEEEDVYEVDEEESIEQRRVVYSDEIREDVDIDDLRDKVIEDKQSEYSDPQDYFYEIFGSDWYLEEFFKDYMDWDSWIDDMLYDGYAQEIAWYDGYEVELGVDEDGDTMYGYRRN